jgi:hypothetical protein
MRAFSRLWLAALLAMTLSCGSSSDGGAATCSPGSTQACLGPGACSGAQSCKDDGSGWNGCDCGGKTDSGATSDTSTPDDSGDTATSGDTGTPTDTTTPGDDTSIGDTPVDTGPITALPPDKLTGLGLWLDSDKGVILTADTFFALKWLDQSPLANLVHLSCGGGCSGGCTLTCGLKRFIADTKGGHDAYQVPSFGHIDCCNFDGSTILVDDDASLQFGRGPFALFIVAKSPGVSVPIDLWFKRDFGTSLEGLSVMLDTYKLEVKTATASAKLTFAASTAGYRLMVVRGPALNLRVDGVVATGTTATDDLSTVGKTLVIGFPTASGGSGTLAIAEYVAVKGAVSDAQVLGVEAYLKSKYKMSF